MSAVGARREWRERVALRKRELYVGCCVDERAREVSATSGGGRAWGAQRVQIVSQERWIARLLCIV
jgi:hypothetical protein